MTAFEICFLICLGIIAIGLLFKDCYCAYKKYMEEVDCERLKRLEYMEKMLASMFFMYDRFYRTDEYCYLKEAEKTEEELREMVGLDNNENNATEAEM